MKNLDFVTLTRDIDRNHAAYEEAVLRVLNSGNYILGSEVARFEKEFAEYLGVKYCIGLNSGSDALYLALLSLNIGMEDEVIVPANTYIGTVLAITRAGAAPVLIEPNEYYNIDTDKIEDKITNRTKAIMPVHLYGQVANMTKVKDLALKYNLKVIEDCAQAHGATFKGQLAGTFSNLGCFSFYPTKNLGAFGDAGAIATDDKELADKIRMLRHYGQREKYYNQLQGINSRLDEMQAALLSVKLKCLDEMNLERKRIAERYIKEIQNEKVILPKIMKGCNPVWHLFVVRVEDRKHFIKYLSDNSISSAIHYPIPPHKAECYASDFFYEQSLPIAEKYAESVVSIPLYIGMTEDEINFVINIINAY